MSNVRIIMSPLDALAECAETADWSDPLVGLQVREFQHYLERFRAIPNGILEEEKEIDAPRIVTVAEYLCEWSRILLNRTFGRTTPSELDQITSLFADTAEQIRNWALLGTFDNNQKRQIQAYAVHIQQRTGFLRG